MSTKPQQVPFSEADLLSAGATLRYIYTLHASNDPECRPRYVGFTIRPKRRETEHNCGWESGRKGDWTRALLELGQKVVLKVIHKFRSDDLAERAIVEASWIESYQIKFPDLLNDAGGGCGVAKPSEEWRVRNSESKKKYFRDNPDAVRRHSEAMRRRYKDDPLARKKTSEGSKRFWSDPSNREKKSQHSKKYWADPASKEKQSRRVKNRYKTVESRKAHGEMLKARFADPEVRKKFSESNRQRYLDPKEREKTGAASKKFWANPENRKRMIEAAKLRCANPAVREKMREAAKRKHLERLLDEF